MHIIKRFIFVLFGLRFCVSGSIAKTDMKQRRWKYSVLSNASDRINPAITHDPSDHYPGHPEI